MTICIPTASDTGASARLSPDFGRAPYFTLVDVESARAWAVPNADGRYEPGERSAPGTMEARFIDAVACRGMGAAALSRLRARGVPVLATEALTVADAVRAFREGTLPRLGLRATVPHRQGRHGAARTREEQ